MSEFNGAFDNAIIWFGSLTDTNLSRFDLSKYDTDDKFTHWCAAILRFPYTIHKITNIDWPKLKQWVEEQ